MKYPQHKQEIEQLLSQERTLTVKDFADVLAEMPKGSVYARIRELTEQGTLTCIGKGKYLSVRKPRYRTTVTPWMKEVASYLVEHCEGVNHCIIAKEKNLEVQVYKADVPRVLQSLKQGFSGVVRKKGIEAVEDDLEGYILVGPMVSESPLTDSEGVFIPSLEKELIDNLCSGLPRPILLDSFQKRAEVYAINYNRLKRYAARRGVKEELNQVLDSLDTERIGMFAKIQKYLARTRVSRAWVFGSFARGEEKDGSDIDLLVDYDKTGGLSLLAIVRYKLDLEQILGREVDLVENGYLRPFAAPSAEQDKYLIYER